MKGRKNSRDTVGKPLFHRDETSRKLLAQAHRLLVCPLLPGIFEISLEAFARLRELRGEIRLRGREPFGTSFFARRVNRNLGIFFRLFRPYRRDLGIW